MTQGVDMNPEFYSLATILEGAFIGSSDDDRGVFLAALADENNQ